ncbi:MAG: glycosyltransferase [Acidobacteria bacterium]|nr:glycosyltransferase [Acidobacteriota bacterium]
MKILFINTVDIEGGAAIAAYRLNKELEHSYGTENLLIVGKKVSHDPNVFDTRRNKGEVAGEIKTFSEYLLNKIFNKLGFQYRCFPFSSRFIMKKAREFKPDIISLHNIHGGYFPTPLLKRLSKIAPIVWTLHDMWAITANAAHTFGDDSWKQLRCGKGEKNIYPFLGLNTGNWLIKQKKKIYQKSDLYIVAPSQWLYELAKEAPVFAGKEEQVFLVPHGIDLELFKKRDKKSCRRALGIAEDARVFMFSSADDITKSSWKGGQLLLDILEAIDAQTKDTIDVLVLGRGRMETLVHLKNLRVHHLGFINSEKFLPVLFSAADLFIYPTRADSLGLALVEAIACETPCITFRVGGCVDVIRDGANGYVIEPFDVETFAAKTLELLGNTGKLKKMSANGREWSETNFALPGMAKKYYQLFEKIITAKNAKRREGK